MKTAKRKFDLPTILEIEISTANLWISTGAIKITDKGDENTYYENEFGHQFFCKNRMLECDANDIC